MARTKLGSPRSPSPTANYHFLLSPTRSPFPHSIASHLMDHRKQQRSPGAASSGKHGGGKGGKAGGSGSGGKKPIKMVYISNPVRVKTNAAGFRALVQELTGRHADPSKYSADEEDAAARAQQELSPEGSAAASTPDAAAPGPAAAPDFAAAANGDRDEEEEEDIFGSQLLDNDYSVFSPTTLFYDYPHGSSNKDYV